MLNSAVQQSDSIIHIYSYFFRFFSIMVYSRILTLVPYAIRSALLFIQSMCNVCVCLVIKPCLTLCDPGTVACHAPLFVGFLGKNTRVDCHVLLQKIFLNQGSIEPESPALQADSLQSEPLGKPSLCNSLHLVTPNSQSFLGLCLPPWLATSLFSMSVNLFQFCR